MKKYKGIDYESGDNCFEKCAEVKTILIYGDESIIPKPWITLLIPTYKRPDLLKQAIESALTQAHCKFMWDIVVLDNEPYNGKANETERLIRKLDNKRILYYRNSENIRPGDNFNRGFLLARGEYVMMLHDDDLLMGNTMQRMGNYITAYSKIGAKPVGAVCASYVQVEYDSKQNIIKADISGMNKWLATQPMDYSVYVLTQNNVKVTGHIGGAVPSNGTTFNKKAVIDVGGFNEDYGIMGDQILLYNLMKKYSVYQTRTQLGFYRWGANSMIKPELTRKVIQNGYEFREYVYSKHHIVGKLFRKCHFKKFTHDVVWEKNQVSAIKVSASDFDDIYDKKPGFLSYFFYRIVARTYDLHKKSQTKKLTKKACKEMENEEWSKF